MRLNESQMYEQDLTQKLFLVTRTQNGNFLFRDNKDGSYSLHNSFFPKRYERMKAEQRDERIARLVAEDLLRDRSISLPFGRNMELRYIAHIGKIRIVTMSIRGVELFPENENREVRFADLNKLPLDADSRGILDNFFMRHATHPRFFY